MPHPKRICQIRIPQGRIDEVCLALHELGYRWGGGQTLEETHYSYRTGDTIYSLYLDKTVRYGGMPFHTVRMYEVDEFLQEFCGLVDEEDLNIESLL